MRAGVLKKRFSQRIVVPVLDETSVISISSHQLVKSFFPDIASLVFEIIINSLTDDILASASPLNQNVITLYKS